MSQAMPQPSADKVVSLEGSREAKLWAVVASVGRKNRIAEIYANRAAADADRQWREQQVRAYAGFLRSSSMPMPNYSVSAIRRADLPRAWKPLPALGFLRSQFI